MESKCTNTGACYHEYESPECNSARSLTDDCFREKVSKKVNDLSKALTGQDLYSLASGPVKCCAVTPHYVKCVPVDDNKEVYWYFDGSRVDSRVDSRDNEQEQDLYWHKPKIEFQPDPVRKVLKKKEVWVHYTGDVNWGVSNHEDPIHTILATMTFELEE